MDKDNEGENTQQDREQKAAAANDDPCDNCAKTSVDQKQDADIRQLEKRERALILLAWLGFAIAIGSLGVSFLQWRAMREQLADARAQYKQDRLDAEADARVQSGRFERQAGLMADSNRALKDAIDALQAGARSERETALRSIKLADEAMRRANSPVLSLEDLAVSLGPGSRLNVRFSARNTGPVPAGQPVFVCSIALFTKRNGVETFDEVWGVEREVSVLIGPQQSYSFECVFDDAKITPEFVSRMESRESSIVLFAQTLTTTEFGNRVYAYGCWRMEGPALTPTACNYQPKQTLFPQASPTRRPL